LPATTSGYGSRALVPDRHVIALDLGGTKLAGGLVAADGTVGARLEGATEQSDQDALVRQIEDSIAALEAPSVVALGIGIPSLIDQKAGRVGSSVNVPLEGIDLRDRLEERFGRPVVLENDANAAAVAEHRLGAGRGCDHMVMLTLGTGIGGGLILNGALYRGAIGAAAELGHMTVDIRSELPCEGRFCPGFGHLEGLASGRAAARRAGETADAEPDGSLARARAQGQELTAELVVELAEAGEPDALELLDSIGFDLGIGIASYVNIFNPEVVVVGGGFGVAGDLLLEPARRVVAERALPTARDSVRIVEAKLGPDAGLIGAGLLGFDIS
jgi:glucokinase